MAADCETLDRFLCRESVACALSADAAALVLDIAAACAAVGRRLSDGVSRPGSDRPAMAPHPTNTTLLPLNENSAAGQSAYRDWTARSISSLREGRESASCGLHRGRHLALLMPVDCPANLDLNATVGTTFSIFEARESRSPDDVAGRRSAPLCAGYAIHGPSLILVVALAAGVNAFAYDRRKDEFVLTHADMRIPAATDEIAVDAADMRLPERALRRYLDECLAGEAGPRGRRFRFRWCGSTVAEVHRLLMRGGVLVCPGFGGTAVQRRAPRLLEEVAPLSYVVERAGGRASTVTGRIADAALEGTRLREPLLLGAVDEIERIEAYHRDPDSGPRDTPLFGVRGLFRPAV